MRHFCLIMVTISFLLMLGALMASSLSKVECAIIGSLGTMVGFTALLVYYNGKEG